ncbi:hypothetical protein C791_3351 [Amycolatopsis azurea DSM 43854]|uniref:Uncharacterized protein n=1 Tax=Amycolatopsis azurea DSM 43854 TaxID=1238180 RepID=M2QKX3_9PSEU|nr:hypothetical protein C791_3351 [Amycolatopsis azurea DSM 43854]
MAKKGLSMRQLGSADERDLDFGLRTIVGGGPQARLDACRWFRLGTRLFTGGAGPRCLGGRR